jgi:hypothetical protein
MVLILLQEQPQHDDCREIAKFKQQKQACFEAKAGPGELSLSFALKRQLKPEKAASSKNRKAEFILSVKVNLTTSCDEVSSKSICLLLLHPLVTEKLT